MQGADAPDTNIGLGLPVELQKLTLECLEKHELKQVRLVSKECNSLAIPLLFDRVYISPQPLNSVVFLKIAAHPIICETVREIIYDVSHFDPDISRREYYFKVAHRSPFSFTRDLSKTQVIHTSSLSTNTPLQTVTSTAYVISTKAKHLSSKAMRIGKSMRHLNKV